MNPMCVKVRMTGRQHQLLRSHLFPGDGLEAAAVALCGRRSGEGFNGLSVRTIVPIPHGECVRERDRITWPTARLEPLLHEAMKRHWAVLKIHSHPQDYPEFSLTDDRADRELFSSVHGWVDDDLPHASVVMQASGRMFGRWIDSRGVFHPLDCISVAGDDMMFWHGETLLPEDEADLRNKQAFGEGTIARLRALTVAVIGCSGTGSPVIEQLARYRLGRLILVDPDRVEDKNLNRIIHATRADANARALKVQVIADAVRRMGLGTEVVTVAENLCDAGVLKLLAEADVLVGCMDGAEGRAVLNRLACFYNLPYFDVGVRLDADGIGGIDQLCGTVHYLQPDGSSLFSRQVITQQEVSDESLKRRTPGLYEERLKQAYIKGVEVDRPAVVSVNMHYASLAVLELLARLHPYRADPNSTFARHGSSLVNNDHWAMGEGDPCRILAREAGRGDTVPMLDMPSLG